MSSGKFTRRITRAALAMVVALTLPAGAYAANDICDKARANTIPKRPMAAPTGSKLMKQLMDHSVTARDRAITDQVLSGNVPRFLRDLTPVSIWGSKNGQPVVITLCVTPGYLSVGNDRDYVQVPVGVAAAAKIASKLGFFLPTPEMVDAIYDQAVVQVSPSPMTPTPQMESTDYLLRHNKTVQNQLRRAGGKPKYLTAGHKKDIVLTKRLAKNPGRVAIYGWHKSNGRPIQPLSTVHGASYADYSHGVRLISRTAYVDGKPTKLENVMKDRSLVKIVSSEGPVDARRLMAGLF